MNTNSIWNRCRGLALGLLVASTATLRADQFDVLRVYWQSNLVNSGSSPDIVASTATNYWGTLNTNSSSYLWSDLPLGSVSANLVTTYDRLQAMALAWATPGCSLQGNAGLASAVADGLDDMNAKFYTTSTSRYNNWYHWEIGVPQAMNDVAVLLYPALTGTQVTNYMTAEDRFGPGGSQQPAGGWMTGANTADIALAVIVRGILGKDATKIASGQVNLSPVFPYVSSGDGFHTDGSFLFHTAEHPLAYNGHYGLVLLGDVANLVNLLQGSTWQITDPNLANVYGWVSNSFEPFVYNGAVMDMVRGRAISWSYETEYTDGATTLAAVRGIAQFAPAAVATAFTNWAASPQIPPRQYHFPVMDRVLALRNSFAFGISMSSSRIANYESINGGNLHGWFTGDGMVYLYLGGTDTQFTSDFWPTVDAYHLPGTTVETNSRADSANEETLTTENWVGGAQVAQTYGAAGMSLAAVGTTLTGRKSWFMFDNEVVCLGAGITCGDTAGIHTTVENRRLGLSPTNNFWVNGVKVPPVMGWNSNLTTTTWCALDGLGGYYFPGGATNLQASFVTTTGSWFQVNNIDITNLYTDAYLKLYYNHGVKPTNSTYAYVLLPNLNVTSVSNYALNPDILVLTNTASLQAVTKPALGIVAANFWTNGNSSAGLISVNSKASIITSENNKGISVGISDPTQTNKSSIIVTLNRKASALVSADSGVTVQQLAPQIILSVNVSGAQGKTFQAAFSYPSFSTTVVYTNGGKLVLSFPTLTGFNYQLQYKNQLTDPAWLPFGGVFAGSNSIQFTNDPVTNVTRYYRVLAQ